MLGRWGWQPSCSAAAGLLLPGCCGTVVPRAGAACGVQLPCHGVHAAPHPTLRAPRTASHCYLGGPAQAAVGPPAGQRRPGSG